MHNQPRFATSVAISNSRWFLMSLFAESPFILTAVKCSEFGQKERERESFVDFRIFLVLWWTRRWIAFPANGEGLSGRPLGVGNSL